MVPRGHRETISERAKRNPARSSRCGKVSGKSIIVPRMGNPHSRRQITKNLQTQSQYQIAQQSIAWAGWYHGHSGVAASATCPNGQTLPANAKTFPLQNQLIFETIPLTAEAPVSRPWWLGYPDCPCTTLVLRRAPRLATGF